jgi:hypothetical protein
MARVARRSAAWVQPWPRSWASRQARISAAETSMPESRPNPTRLTDPAATPAATAIVLAGREHVLGNGLTTALCLCLIIAGLARPFIANAPTVVLRGVTDASIPPTVVPDKPCGQVRRHPTPPKS